MDIKVGDEVRVIRPSARYHGAGSPEGGWPGRVTKTGRKYATAEYATATRSGTVEFDMATGIERGSANSTYAVRVKTPAQVEREARKDKARESLFKAGISVSGPHERLTLEQWEALAEVAAALPEYERR